MELLQIYAPEVWLLYIKELEALKGKLERDLNQLKRDGESVRDSCTISCSGLKNC